MSESLRPTDGETIFVSSANLQVAIAGVALLGLDDRLIQAENAENERRQIIDSSIAKLKKRYGEEFIKGERLASGGNAGRGARELLSTFLEYPDFSDKLKQLIPNKHRALSTLRDNLDYIIAKLTRAYEDECQYEPEQPKDPYELAKNAGYELTGPFERVEDFMVYSKDFRPGELICTYTGDTKGRLEAYHITWLRSNAADTVPPANELTHENLTPGWREYLRTLDRYDTGNDSYDLDGLRPTREDPYGTSSMSVQISRTGKHVSIKNRYNHTVANPDNTYGNDLDNVADGLKLAVYHLIDREDLLEDDGVSISDNYVLDKVGGIHPYFYEKNNIYLGDYEYIENSIVNTIDRGAYDMLSPELYVGKRKDGKFIAVYGNGSLQTSFETLDGDTHKLTTYDRGKPQHIYEYTYGERGKVGAVELTITESAKTDYICDNPVLTKLTIAEGARTNSIGDNPALTELTIAKGGKAGRIANNPALTEFTIAEGGKTGYIGYNPALTELTIANGAETGYIASNPVLTKLTIAEGGKTGSIYDNPVLTKLTIAEGARTNSIAYNPALTELTIADGAETGYISNNPVLTELTIAEGGKTRNIYDNPALTELTIDEGAETGCICYNPSLITVIVAKSAVVESITNNHPAIAVRYKY